MKQEKEIKQKTNDGPNGPKKPADHDHDRAVKDTKQPAPTNQPTRKTDPSSSSFSDEEEE